MRTREIFTPGRFPTWTYVDDHLKDKEDQLRDTIEDGSMLVSISGPSKSGKTVFVENVLGRENLIQVTGAGVKTPSDLWLRVFDIIGTPIERSSNTSSTKSGTIGGKVGGEGGILVAKAKGEASASASYESGQVELETAAIDFLQLLIRELADTDFVVFIDDFHYIEHSIQSDLAEQIKEAIRQGVKFICASVPYHSDDVIRSNPDLRGRFFSIDFDYWNSDFLKKIAYKGFDKANIVYRNGLVDRLAEEAAGSPQLMQYLCLNACLEKGIRDVPDSPTDLIYEKEFFDEICRRTVASTDYSSIAEKMLDGPKTRGSDRKIYISKFGWQGDVYRFLLKALSVDPPRLNFRYQPLVDRIGSLCDGVSPSGSSITNACFHTANIANDSANDNVVEWDGENDVFDIRDPYLLFYLRWSEIADG
ncbi:MAG: hypothetical protein VX935_03725 [Pseudomonadota bacterium]|jgi:hypothetical protein|uniref:hypothetical protein n=1 Tax=Alloalcanivorax venustensis TaxID=172371 RepID=UPI000A78C8AD|nr:ATP-binding protein [Alcanivorax sp.]MCH2551041.1 hypothetical protein [Alcanivorax sp.]MEC8878998.1 hypothetical protein [Pseudomonadota bacterium]MED5601508.1 hypothetical protein [Pseudomonadota bacterium]|tara:strand:- start:3207 stop:4466 length:1260 start_codon:yes stop_codon:yes gene_type:complete